MVHMKKMFGADECDAIFAPTFSLTSLVDTPKQGCPGCPTPKKGCPPLKKGTSRLTKS